MVTPPRGWRLLLAFCVCVLLIGALCSTIALPLVQLTWWKTFRRCISLAAAASLWLFITRVERRSFRSYGVDFTSRAGEQELLMGLAAGALILGVLYVVGMLTGACLMDVTPNQVKLWRTLLVFVPGALVVGLLEELVFRGYMFQQLAARLPWLVAALSTSLLYAGLHVRGGDDSIVLLSRQMIGLTLFGMMLSGLVRVTGRLNLAIGFHAALAYGARVNKLLISIPDSPWTWLTGTSRLINGVAGWMTVLLVGGMLMWWARQRRQQEG